MIEHSPSGSVAIVTGGAGAIGAAVCHRLAANGWQVAVIDVDPDAAAQFAAELSGEGQSQRTISSSKASAASCFTATLGLL